MHKRCAQFFISLDQNIKRMKRLIKQTLLFIFLITLGCQREKVNPNDSTKGLAKTKITSLTNEPYLKDILDKIGFQEAKNGRTSSSGTRLNTDSILMALQADSVSYAYTFMVEGDYRNGSFTNLVFKRVVGGVKGFYLKYEPDTSSPFNISRFSGKVTSYNLGWKEIASQYFVNGKVAKTSSSGGRSQNCVVTVTISKYCQYENEFLKIDNDIPCLYGNSTTSISVSYSPECYITDSGGATGGSNLPLQYTRWSDGTFIPSLYFNFNSPGGGPAGSSGGSPCTSGGGGAALENGADPNSCNDVIGVYPPPTAELKAIRKAYFESSELSPAKLLFLENNQEIAANIYTYLESHVTTETQLKYPREDVDFMLELLDLAINQNNNDLSKRLITILLVTKNHDYFHKSLDANFLYLIDPYVDLDLSNQDFHDPLTTYLIVKSSVLKAQHPDWSDAKILWEAMKDVVHVGLDIFGLIPLLGEAADLTNGILYTLEGDYLNAGFSVAAAVPVLGTTSTVSKYTLKVINSATDVTSKTKLVWKSSAAGIYFGSDSWCRQQLRKVLGLAVGDLRQAHHIIPINKQGNEVIQKAAQSGSAFHLNEALNGIPLSTAVHNGSHANYDNLVEAGLQRIRNQYGPNMTPQQAYDALTSLINNVRTAILNNPNTPINQLVF